MFTYNESGHYRIELVDEREIEKSQMKQVYVWLGGVTRLGLNAEAKLCISFNFLFKTNIFIDHIKENICLEAKSKEIHSLATSFNNIKREKHLLKKLNTFLVCSTKAFKIFTRQGLTECPLLHGNMKKETDKKKDKCIC